VRAVLCADKTCINPEVAVLVRRFCARRGISAAA